MTNWSRGISVRDWSWSWNTTHQILLCVTFPLLHNEELFQGVTFKNCWRDSDGYEGHSKQLAGEWLLEVLWQLETTLEIMYSCSRELL
jgi:hypothetical protein